MRVVDPSFEVYWRQSGADMLKFIEATGRTAYKSEARITDESAETFVRKLVNRGHWSVLEHVAVSARVVCDRGVSHEIVRHRLASYTQESTRWCDYSNYKKFKKEITFVCPLFVYGLRSTDPISIAWHQAMGNAERSYFGLLEHGAKPQEARSVLPNSLKTEIVMTMNLRTWRHFFSLRAAPLATRTW